MSNDNEHWRRLALNVPVGRFSSECRKLRIEAAQILIEIDSGRPDREGRLEPLVRRFEESVAAALAVEIEEQRLSEERWSLEDEGSERSG
jgi:hypothetical protein